MTVMSKVVFMCLVIDAEFFVGSMNMVMGLVRSTYEHLT